MIAKEFDLIIIESFVQEAKQTYFNAKREQFKCNPDEYFTGLMNSFKRLNDEVNKTDYLSAIVTTPEGEEREYHLSSDSSSEQTIFLRTIGKVSFPKKRTIDLRLFTDGKFNGYLTAELMAGLWPDLHKYCQSIIDAKTKKIQEIRGELQKSESIKEDEVPNNDKEPENPHPRIFLNYKCWQLFEYWRNEVKERTQLAEFSFIFWQMQKDSLIYEDVKPTEFRNWMLKTFSIVLEPLKQLTVCKGGNKYSRYQSAKLLFKC